MTETDPAGYLRRPSYDDDLRGFRQGLGGGWVTKVPHGGGMLYAGLLEAGRSDYMRWLHAKREDLYALADDPGHPANAAKHGLLMRATFVNLSEREFCLEWTKLGRCHGLSLAMCQDLEMLWTPVKDRPWAGKVKDGDSPFFEPDIRVKPGGRKEAYLVFKPVNERAVEDQVVHGLHVAMATMNVPHDFGPGFQSTARGPIPVPFPFFNPDARVPNSRAELEFSLRGGGGFIVMPPLQSVHPSNADPSAPPFITTGLARVDLPKEGETSFRVESCCSRPGTPPLEAGSLARFRQTASGFRFPRGLRVTNPAPTSQGAPAMVIPGWEPYSYKQEKAAKKAWEELPSEKKIEHAQELIAQADTRTRLQGIEIMAREGNLLALPHLVKLFKDKDENVARAAKTAYRNIQGISYDDEQRIIAERKAFDDHIADIARREGRVTYVNIRDSILSRTSIFVPEGGEAKISVDDSIVHRSQLDGNGGKEGGPSGPAAPEGYQERLALYEKALKAALRDGKVTPEEQRLLEALRKKYGISEDEHEMLLDMSR